MRVDGGGDTGGSGSVAGGRVAKKRKGNRQRMLQLIRSDPNHFANPEGCPVRKYLMERVDDWWLTDAQRPARLVALMQQRKERLATKREAEESWRVAWERMEDQRVRIGQYTRVPAGGGSGNKVVGKAVEKQFGRRFYKGVVKMYVPDEQWYLVGLPTTSPLISQDFLLWCKETIGLEKQALWSSLCASKQVDLGYLGYAVNIVCNVHC